MTGVADTVCACVCEPQRARRCGLKGGTESQQLLQRAPAWIGPSASCSSTSRILWEGLEGNTVPSAKAFQWLLLILQHSCGNTGVVVGPASTPLESPDFLLPITGSLICYPWPERRGNRASAQAAQGWCCSCEVYLPSEPLAELKQGLKTGWESQKLAHSKQRV